MLELDYDRYFATPAAREITDERTVEIQSPMSDGWFSQRTHGRLDPNRGTIVNTRDKIGRNGTVKISGEATMVGKMKRFNHPTQPIPYEVFLR